MEYGRNITNKRIVRTFVRDVYHRSLRVISGLATMAKEKEFLRYNST